jgi:DNA adenine methylase
MDSPLSYIGGKSRLSNIITQRIPPHKTYCEAFCGAAWVFFRKEQSKYEVINDLDGDLISFYRVVQNHLEEFLKQFRWILSSRQWWDEWKKQQEAGGLTDIQRAARYYYVQRHSYAGKVRGRAYGSTAEHNPRINLLRLEEEMSQVHLRLATVAIENLDYREFIRRYDREATFFYIDPPYFKAPYYKHNLLRIEDYREMAELLGGVKGKWLLSINDMPAIREAFAAFSIDTANVRYMSTKEKTCIGKELLICNYA